LKVVQWNNKYDGMTNIIRIDPYHGHKSSYSVSVEIFDAGRTLIGKHERVDAGDPGSDRKETAGPLSVPSKLESVLVVTPEKQNNGYVQFKLGDLSWPSNNDIPPENLSKAKCTESNFVTSEDGKEAFRYIDCEFDCRWGGGKSSDGSN
jgi:hypothetical protein